MKTKQVKPKSVAIKKIQEPSFDISSIKVDVETKYWEIKQYIIHLDEHLAWIKQEQKQEVSRNPKANSYRRHYTEREKFLSKESTKFFMKTLWLKDLIKCFTEREKLKFQKVEHQFTIEQCDLFYSGCPDWPQDIAYKRSHSVEFIHKLDFKLDTLAREVDRLIRLFNKDDRIEMNTVNSKTSFNYRSEVKELMSLISDFYDIPSAAHVARFEQLNWGDIDWYCRDYCQKSNCYSHCNEECFDDYIRGHFCGEKRCFECPLLDDCEVALERRSELASDYNNSRF